MISDEKLILTIGSIFIVFIIVLIIIKMSRRKKEKESSLKTDFTTKTIKELSAGLLKTAHYFLSEDLILKRIDKQDESISESGKMVLKSSSFENQIVITKNTKGKLIETNEGEVKIQFDTGENCFLVFRETEKGLFELYTEGLVADSISVTPVTVTSAVDIKAPVAGTLLKQCFANGTKVEKGQTVIIIESMKMELEVNAPEAGTITYLVSTGSQITNGQILASVSGNDVLLRTTYNNNEYFANKQPTLMYKLERQNSHKTKITKAKGAW